MIGMTPEHPAPILSLTVIDADTGGRRILLGVRRAETHPTHPNVVSVPTERLPPAVYDAILARCERQACEAPKSVFAEETRAAWRLAAEARDSRSDSGHDPLVFAVESLVCRKLGLAEALEHGACHFRARPAALLVGATHYEPNGESLPGDKIMIKGEAYYREYCAMLNVLVELSGAAALPAATASYSAFRWMSLPDFPRLVASRDHELLFALFQQDSVHYCVHGLCLLSSAVAINQP